MLRRTFLSFVSMVTLAVAQVQAQAPAARPQQMHTCDPALFNGLRYRLVGPSRGGRVTTVTGVPSQPKTFYMGVASGGLFRTTDAGATCFSITDGKVPLGSTGCVAVADSNPNVIYLGTGSDDVRSNVSTGRGMYKSTDVGQTWKFIGLYNAGQIGSVRIHPTNPDIVWVSAQGDAFKANAERGVFKSTDGGEHFTKIASGLPNELIGKANLAVTAAKPTRIYALVEAKPGGGLYRSDDAGQSWTAMNPQPATIAAAMIQRPFYYVALGADPTNADVVYAGAEGFFKSTDGGKTFSPFRTPHGDNHDIWISPKDGNIMIQSNDGGANVSFDGGRTWSTQLNQPTAEIYGVWLDNQFPYKLYGAQQDNTTIIISRQPDATGREEWKTGPGCETGPIMPYPKNPDIVYGSCKGQYGVMNLKTGQEKNYWIGAQSLY